MYVCVQLTERHVLADNRSRWHHHDVRRCNGPQERGERSASQHASRVPGDAIEPSAQPVRHRQNCRNCSQEARHSLCRRQHVPHALLSGTSELNAELMLIAGRLQVSCWFGEVTTVSKLAATNAE